MSNWGYSQLDNFTLNISTTDETCPNNGSVTFTVNNQTAGSNMSYAIYLLPNTTTPVVTLTGGVNSFNTLASGQYQVVATQTLAGNSANITDNFEIENLIVNLTYNIILNSPATCSNNGSITVNVTQGKAVEYEILSPIVVAPQTSPTFNNLAQGLYLIRVTDACGNKVSQNYTLNFVQPVYNIGDVAFGSSSCNNINLIHEISTTPGINFLYPINGFVTVNYPDNTSENIPINVTSGSILNFNVAAFYNQNFNYTINLTDGCNNAIQGQFNINISKSFSLLKEVYECSKQRINIVTGISISTPYTINFVSAPLWF